MYTSRATRFVKHKIFHLISLITYKITNLLNDSYVIQFNETGSELYIYNFNYVHFFSYY